MNAGKQSVRIVLFIIQEIRLHIVIIQNLSIYHYLIIHIMIKINFAQEHTKDYSLILGVSFTNVEVPHPNKYFHPKQPTLTLSLSVWHWSGYMMIYKPANIAMNRHDRRRFHI